MTDSDQSKPKLYSYFRSSCAWRVRIALALKGIDYETIPVNLLKNEQNDANFLKVNKLAQVPALEIDGQVFTQSLSIIEYLEETRPEPALFPKDPVARARVRQIAEIIASGIQPLQNLSVITKVSNDPEQRMDFAHYWITRGFSALETLLESSSGTYCVGDQITLADVCLAPQIAAAERFKVRLDDYPTIKRIHISISKLDAFVTAHMTNQVDCPPELKTSH